MSNVVSPYFEHLLRKTTIKKSNQTSIPIKVVKNSSITFFKLPDKYTLFDTTYSHSKEFLFLIDQFS